MSSITEPNTLSAGLFTRLKPLAWGPVLGAALYFVIAFAAVAHHELWRDEMQSWLIARESGSVAELLKNYRYEGHPGVWFFLLYAVTRCAASPFWMQMLNLAIATGSAYLILSRAPFRLLHRILLCASYFVFYEYGTISRNYGAGVFLLLLYCAVTASRQARWWVAAGTLALLANTSVFGTILALSLTAGTLVLPFIAGKREEERPGWSGREVALGAGLVIAACLLAALQMNPPPDAGFAEKWRLDLDPMRVAMTAAGAWVAHLPLPASTDHFWNTNLVSDSLRARWLLPASVVLLAFLGYCLARSRSAFVTYCLATGGTLVFIYLRLVPYARHFGHLFLAFVACLWLARLEENRGTREGGRRFLRMREVAVTGILVAQCAGSVIAAAADWKLPFSQAKATAEFIRHSARPGVLLVGHVDNVVTGVSGYLGQRIFFLTTGAPGSYKVWRHIEKAPTPLTLFEDARRLATQRQQEILLISNWKLPPGAGAPPALAAFEGSIVADENFYLYTVEPKP